MRRASGGAAWGRVSWSRRLRQPCFCQESLPPAITAQFIADISWVAQGGAGLAYPTGGHSALQDTSSSVGSIVRCLAKSRTSPFAAHQGLGAINAGTRPRREVDMRTWATGNVAVGLAVPLASLTSQAIAFEEWKFRQYAGGAAVFFVYVVMGLLACRRCRRSEALGAAPAGAPSGRCQFGLSTLLVVTTFAALLCGLVPHVVAGRRGHRRARRGRDRMRYPLAQGVRRCCTVSRADSRLRPPRLLGSPVPRLDHAGEQDRAGEQRHLLEMVPFDLRGATGSVLNRERGAVRRDAQTLPRRCDRR